MMRPRRFSNLRLALMLAAALLIVKVTLEVVWGYRNYLPLDFNADFLRGREDYFFSGYQWAFFAHITTGPAALILGLILISERFRQQFPRWHRILGRIQVAGILLFVAPSGLWMAFYTQSGKSASVGFALLAILTGVAAAMGWRSAVKRRFLTHKRWMWRCFLLLCSAVVIRVLGGLATLFEIRGDWFDPLTAWACWVVPLLIYEVAIRLDKRKTPHPISAAAATE